MSTEHTVPNYLAEHPRMTGVLFMLFLLLTQAGQVAGAGGSVTIGP